MEHRQVATLKAAALEMDKEAQVKCMRSTTTPLSAIAQAESQDCICTPSNPELKINYPSITKKPLVTPTFDPINMSKFKGIGKKPITKTSSVVVTAKAKRAATAVSKDLELKTLKTIHGKSGESPKIVNTQKYFSSLSKLSSELPLTTRAVTAHPRRVTSSKSPEKGSNSNPNSYCQFNSSMNFKTTATRPKTVQTFLGRSLPGTSSSTSGKKPVPGALLDTLSYFQEKSSINEQQVTNRSRSKSKKLGEQIKDALNIILPSPYTTTSTKLPTIANPQLGSRGSRFTKNSLENSSNVKNGTGVMNFHSSGPGSRPRSRQTGKDNSATSVVKDAPTPNNLHSAPRSRSRQLTAKDNQTSVNNLPSAIRPHFRLTLKDTEVKPMPNPNLRSVSVTHSAKQTVKESSETKDATELINLNKVKVTRIRSSSRQTAKENSDIKDEKLKATTTPAPVSKEASVSISKPKFEKSTLKFEKMTKILPTAKPQRKTQKLSERLAAISVPIPPVPVPEQRSKQSNQRFQIEIKTDSNNSAGNSSTDKPNNKATVPVTVTPPTSALSLPTAGGSKLCSLKQNENQTTSTINENTTLKVKSPKSNRIHHEPKPTYARPFTPTTPKSTRLSRPSSAAKVHQSTKYIDDNFSALLLQTVKLSIENENGISMNFPKSSAAAATTNDCVSTHSDQLIHINDISIPQNMKMDNVDNLPFPVSLKTSNENNYAVADKESETTVINPPVNTPVSPKSPTTSDSDSSNKYDAENGSENKTQSRSRSTNKSYYGDATDQENENSSLSKLGNTFSHDFINEYLQLESVREVNHVPQVMFRTKVCREFKGADPNLTLEHLKFTRSHYLQLPCFADPQFFLKIKVPPIAFMGNNKNKKHNSDLLTIQYFQNKMESLSRNNLRSTTAEAQSFLKRDKTDPTHQSATNPKSLVSTLSTDLTTKEIHTAQSRDNPNPGFGTGTGTGKTTSSKDLFSRTSIGDLGIGNLTKAFYIQSLQTIFKSLELPVWAKDCFGSISDDEFDDCNDDDDDGLDIDDGEDNDTTLGGDGDTLQSLNNIFNFTNSSSLYKPSSTMIESPAGAGAGHDREDGGATLAQRILNIYESRKMKNIQNIEVDIDKSIVLKKKGEKTTGSRKARDFEDETSSDNSADSP